MKGYYGVEEGLAQPVPQATGSYPWMMGDTTKNMPDPNLNTSFNGGKTPGMGSTDSLSLNGMQPNKGMDFSTAMNNFSLGAQGITGLAGAYSAWRQTGLMKDQLQLQEAAVNRNIQNSATTTNAASLARARMAAQMYGTTPGTPEYEAKVAELHTPVNGSRL